MKILLICPSISPSPSEKTIWGKLLPSLALEILAALTPERHEVRVLHEDRDDIDLDADADLIGITTMTMTAVRAYRLCDEFRKRGRKVVLGGIHPSLLPREALDHADAVVVGEAEGVWGELLSDAEASRLRTIYSNPASTRTVDIPIVNWAGRKRSWFEVVPVQTTRGCPYSCDFCSCSIVFGTRPRHVPVDRVVTQVARSGAKNILFLDDNVVGDPAYAKELFRALVPLNIRWGGQASVSMARDEELLKLAVRSGCRILLFGLESVSTNSMAGLKKSIKDTGKLQEAIRRIQDAGIHFHPSLIFGFDSDDKNIFAETLDFMYRNSISTAGFCILTPFPGTPLSTRLQRENRLLTTNWSYYNLRNSVFRPLRMTPLELNVGRLWTAREFERTSAVLRRLTMIPAHSPLALVLLYFAFNLGYRLEIRNDLKLFPAMARDLFLDELNGSSVEAATAACYRELDQLHRDSAT